MRVHFLGIAGSGASAAAAIAEAQGFEVTGCDLNPENEFTTSFKPSQLFKDHSPNHLMRKSYKIPQVSIQIHTRSVHSNIDILAVTPAIYSLDPDNEELREARKQGTEILTWQEFMGKYLMKDKFVIAIAGTHGKTTTTAMIAGMLEDAGLDPTVVLGGIIPKWGTNYRISKKPVILGSEERTTPESTLAEDSDQARMTKELFVVEADEFNDNFLTIKPDIAVVTNIEMDHPEYFKDFENYKESFKKFLSSTKQVVVANLLDPIVADLIKVIMKLPYSQISHGRGTNVQYLDYSKNELNLSLKIPGDFNKLNAAATFQVGLLLGIEPLVIKNSLQNYTGVGRRFEYLGQYKGREVYSDFGHHPTEIKTTMQAAREKFPDKYIWLIYEPHMFTRTKALFKEFVEVFKNLPINQTLILDIYPSREIDTGLVSSKELADAVDKNNVDYVESETELKEILYKEIRPGDIIFFMGAGDIDKIARKLVVDKTLKKDLA